MTRPLTGELPTPESCLLFGVLLESYLLTVQFTIDLNEPFDGVYSVRRSAAATHLLVARKLLDSDLPEGLGFERGPKASDQPRSPNYGRS